jgi:hypothetical protein
MRLEHTEDAETFYERADLFYRGHDWVYDADANASEGWLPPFSASKMQKLACNLDMAELDGDDRSIGHAAVTYEEELWCWNHHQIEKAKNRKHALPLHRIGKLYRALYHKTCHRNEVQAAFRRRYSYQGPSFTLRELIDAEYALDLAAELFYIAKRQFCDAKRQTRRYVPRSNRQ